MSIAGIVGILVFLVTVVAPLAGGVLLIVLSRRRGPDHPACGKCGYNLLASIGAGTRCPECGADFGEAGITPPRGKHSPFMMAAGITLIVLAVGCFGSSLLLSRGTTTPPPVAPNAAAPAAPANAAPSETADDPEADREPGTPR